MSGVSIIISPKGFAAARQKLLAGSRPELVSELLDSVGALIESQTKRRIGEDKTAPDGSAWVAWSKPYAKTRKKGHSLLQSENHLMDSVQYLVHGDAVEIGSNLKYAGVHQEGYKGIPARPYLGLSADDEQELQDLLDDFVSELL